MESYGPITFSDQFDVTRGPDDDWYDPLLHTDSALFVDSYLIGADAEDRWKQSHRRLTSFFNMVLRLLAQSGFSASSLDYQAARAMLRFPEPAEFCLGYSEDSTSGSGSGRKIQNEMIAHAIETIGAGITEVDRFEKLQIFGVNMGADRLSDVVCNVLKADFIRYTQEVCHRHGIPTANVKVGNARWVDDLAQMQWRDERQELPINPLSKRPIILVPQRFLVDLPTVDPYEFYSFAWNNENETLRLSFNRMLDASVDMREIRRIARRHPNIVENYIVHLERRPYDLKNDPKSVALWYEQAKPLISDITQQLTPPRSPAEFCDFVGALLERFKHNIEHGGGTMLLWDGDRPRQEKHVQQLFKTLVYGYCEAYDIDLSPESNAGRGPVDFKFSQGWRLRALVEVKLCKNTRFWKGLQVQLPEYMTSEAVRCGWFLAVQLSESDFDHDRVALVNDTAEYVSTQIGRTVRAMFINAMPQPSASKME